MKARGSGFIYQPTYAHGGVQDGEHLVDSVQYSRSPRQGKLPRHTGGRRETAPAAHWRGRHGEANWSLD